MGIIKSYIKKEHTNLNKLRYKDSSTIGNEPIVQKNIPSSLESRVPSSNEISRRVDDLKRIARVLVQPGGSKFIANEASLYTSTLLASSQPGLKGKLDIIGKGLFNAIKVLGSTLAQVPVNGTGTHFVKGFLPKRKYYEGKFPTSVRKETRLYHGDPGIRQSNNRAYYTTKDENTIDQINGLSPIIGADEIGAKKSNGVLNDLIKFRFTVVTPEQEVMLPFRAYLTDFNDNFTSQWSSYKYLGRAEDFHTYQGLNRSITLGFKIAAQTREEMRPLYQKMVYLASSVAPTYSGNNLMRGTFVKLTVGSYLDEMPGFINSLTYSWNTEYPWEIALNETDHPMNDGDSKPDKDQQELPMVMDCNLTFTPIHRFTPQTGLLHYITTDRVKEDEQLKPFFKDGLTVGINRNEKFPGNRPEDRFKAPGDAAGLFTDNFGVV